jgi:hypothetical protein
MQLAGLLAKRGDTAVGSSGKLEDPSQQGLRDNYGYRAASPQMAICHLRGRRRSGAIRFPVIWQLQAR